MKTEIEKAKQYFKTECFDLFNTWDGFFWIGGGCLRDFFLEKRLSGVDIDLFFNSKSDAKSAKDLLLSLGFKKIGVTLTHWKVKRQDLIFDLCYSYSSPEEWISSVDYTICAAALDSNLTFYHNEHYFKDLKEKKLRRMHQTNRWVAQMAFRLKKFLEYGFEIDKENLIKFLDDLEKTRLYRLKLKNVK